MVSHNRYAFSRQSSIHAGSPFLALMNRTVSSLSPLGANSCSMSELKPHSYFLFAAASASALRVAILGPNPVRFERSRETLRNVRITFLDFARNERK